MTNSIPRDPNAPPAIFDTDIPSFWTRLLSASVEYAKFCSGAIVLVLFCMASYALVHQSGVTNGEVRAWLLPLSLVINVFAALSLLLTGSLLKRISRLEQELTRRDSGNPWWGFLRH